MFMRDEKNGEVGEKRRMREKRRGIEGFLVVCDLPPVEKEGATTTFVFQLWLIVHNQALSNNIHLQNDKPSWIFF